MNRHEQIEELLSAYLDGELTQADSQRVRIHIEDCDDCRGAYREFVELRRITTEMAFPDPPDNRMDELERAVSVQAPRRIGWLFVCLGAAAWIVYALTHFLTSPDLFTAPKMIAAAVVIGGACLLGSVIRQRMLELPHDRYRGVKR